MLRIEASRVQKAGDAAAASHLLAAPFSLRFESPSSDYTSRFGALIKNCVVTAGTNLGGRVRRVLKFQRADFRKCQGHRRRDSPMGWTPAWRTIPAISEAAGCVARVILMFYSCGAYYGSQKARSKSLLAGIFNPIPTSFTPPTA